MKAQTISYNTTPPGQYNLKDSDLKIDCEIITFNDKACDSTSMPPIDVLRVTWLQKMEEFTLLDEPSSGMYKWMHFTNFKHQQILDILKEKYKIHSLTMEDIVRGGQRSKHESFDGYDAIFMQVINSEGSLEKKQLSILFNDKVVISFGEESDVIESIVASITARIKDGKGRIRRKGPDYLAYCLADGVVDSYFTLIESMETRVEETDEEMVKDPSEDVLKKVHILKKDMLIVKKAVWPLREMANSMQRGESKCIKEENFIFIRDLYDHTVRIVETTEGLRDVTYGLIDLYMSSTGMKMNQAMKVLTVISTIFVPITFITSVYGMNFDGIAELHVPHGYAIVWTVMLSIAVSLLFWFKRKKWL